MREKAILALTTTWERPSLSSHDAHDRVTLKVVKRYADDSGINPQVLLTIERTCLDEAGEQLLMFDARHEIHLRSSYDDKSIQACKEMVWNNANAIAIFARYADWSGLALFILRLSLSRVIRD